jgi:AcrR family transcriptional regulator
VAEALLALVEEGDLRPTAPRIAARAGVSLRLVFHHFKDLEAVFADAAKRQLEQVIPTMRLVAGEGALPRRIEAFVAERVRLFERVQTIWRAAEIQEPFSVEISRRLAMVRGWMRDDTERVFERELGKLRGPERLEMAAALGAVSGIATWQELRLRQELAPDRARRVLVRALTRLLKPLM